MASITLEDLLGTAKEQTPESFAQGTRTKQANLSPEDEAARLARLRSYRGLRTWTSADGMFHMHAAVDPASGALLERAINVVAEELWRAEHPDRAPTVAPRETYERRGADALVTIAERILAGDGIKRPGGSGIVAIIDFQVLLERLDDHGVANLSDGTPIPAGLACIWACEHGIIPAVLDTNSVPLDWGEKRRLATPAQRQALLLRSSTCEFAGCTVSAYGCRVHHLEGWEDTHSTDYDNL